jgi:Tol biopolymer transport system component
MRTRVPSRLLARGPLAALALSVVLLLTGAASVASAQTPFVPYFGKNNIHYDNFDWHIYTTDHFEIYYYSDLEKHLERVASYAEGAYQQVSSDLKHDLSFKVPLILFKTHSEFEQQNVAPGAAQEGVGAFAEPFRDRMLLPIDDPPDQLYGLITHELTHIFEFDIIPQGLIRRSVPLWVNEGLSDYERGQWSATDLMMIRDAAISDTVPKMSQMEGYGNTNNALLVYNLGHAVFEFIEARFGKEGIRQFLFALRKSVIGGGEDAYEEALKMKPEEFDQAFERYLKERFKPFRDKERPADYGRDLAPDQEKTHYTQALSIAASPSGDLIAVVTINRKDAEADIVLLSSKDGSMVRNLTAGFDKDFGFTNLMLRGERTNTMPWIAWSPRGDRLAYLVRTEKERTLIVQSVLTGKIDYRIPMKSVDEPESPSFSPDGRTIAISAMREGIRDIYSVNLETKVIEKLTIDDFFDYGPAYAPSGSYLVYNARISGNQKLFRLDLDSKKKTQLTFGTNDESGAPLIDENTLLFSSTATDPNQPLDPEVARNANIYNAWTLDLQSGELKQYTDTVGGVLSPIVLNDTAGPKIGFVSYYKGEYGLHTLERKEPLKVAASADFGAPGPIIDFQAPLQHTLVASNQRRKKPFEKMFLEGRPPVNVGVTNNGDVFGGTEISFGDVLGDKQINVFAASIAQYRTLSLSYVNLGRRFQYALQGYSQTQFFYGQYEGLFYDPALAPLVSRDLAQATRTVRGGSAFGIYPLNRYSRFEISGGLVNLKEQYNDPTLQFFAEQYQQDNFGQQVFRSGTLMPLSAAFVQETTVFREFGPLAGSTMRLAYDVAPKIGGLLSRQTFDGDVRYYQRLATSGVLALRLRGFKSIGAYPDFLYFGGNSEMRGYDYLSFVGQNAVFANAELRFPIIEAALTPIGVVGGIRGVFFANMGGGWFNSQDFTFATSGSETYTPLIGYQTGIDNNLVIDPQTNRPIPIFGTPKTIDGFRLKDGRASYGFGLETFALGFPIHFDWSWRTLFNKDWEDQLFAASGGSSEFRKPRFAVWIGYDF